MRIWSYELKDIEKLYESLKGHLPELEKELEHLTATNDPNVVLLYSRRCMEIIITDLCECELKRSRKTEPLKGIIDKLNREEKVPSHIFTSMDSLNSLSTFGTHPKNYDPEQVRPVLIFLATILKWYLKYKNARITGLTGNEPKEGTAAPAREAFLLNERGDLFEYKGKIDPETLDIVLKELTHSRGFESLDKTTGKRVYAIAVECIENISRHSVRKADGKNLPDPYLTLRKLRNEVMIIAGNSVSESCKSQLKFRLDQINKSDKESLKALFEEKMNKELSGDEKSAGLGFIMIALKSRSGIKYSFNETDQNYPVFEVCITVADYSIKKLLIEKTDCSPGVLFDYHNNIFEISGESRPNDVAGFYGTLLKWLDDFNSYLAGQNSVIEPFNFNFRIDYFNSSSAKYILDFCKKLSSLRTCGYNVNVKWHYKEDDEDMLDAGKEMSRIAKFPFSFIQIKV
jgi:uncharacterized protein YutE (UPF0331/DUF86 family)